MTVADLIAVLQQCEEPATPIRVRVWETNNANSDPVFSRCDIREVTDVKGSIVIDVEES